MRRTLVVWVLWACAYFITNGLNNWMPTLYNRVYGLSLDQALRAGTLTNVAPGARASMVSAANARQGAVLRATGSLRMFRDGTVGSWRRTAAA